MKKYAVIVAGGSGSRMGGGMPKQFRNLNGRPVLWWSMKAFHEEDPATEIILVLPQDFINLWEDFYTSLPEGERFPYRVTAGGDSRGESVENGLSFIEDPEGLVAVHDGARPLLKPSMISTGWTVASESGAAIPVIPVTDSLRKLKETDKGLKVDSRPVDRNEYVAVQTPQIFKVGLLKEAYSKISGKTFTDDAAVVENAGHKVKLFEGSPDNIKITNPADMAVAEGIMKQNV